VKWRVGYPPCGRSCPIVQGGLQGIRACAIGDGHWLSPTQRAEEWRALVTLDGVPAARVRLPDPGDTSEAFRRGAIDRHADGHRSYSELLERMERRLGVPPTGTGAVATTAESAPTRCAGVRARSDRSRSGRRVGLVTRRGAVRCSRGNGGRRARSTPRAAPPATCRARANPTRRAGGRAPRPRSLRPPRSIPDSIRRAGRRCPRSAASGAAAAGALRPPRFPAPSCRAERRASHAARTIGRAAA